MNAANKVIERSASFATKQRGVLGAWFESWNPMAETAEYQLLWLVYLKALTNHPSHC